MINKNVLLTYISFSFFTILLTSKPLIDILLCVFIGCVVFFTPIKNIVINKKTIINTVVIYLNILMINITEGSLFLFSTNSVLKYILLAIFLIGSLYFVMVLANVIDYYMNEFVINKKLNNYLSIFIYGSLFIRLLRASIFNYFFNEVKLLIDLNYRLSDMLIFFTFIYLLYLLINQRMNKVLLFPLSLNLFMLVSIAYNAIMDKSILDYFVNGRQLEDIIYIVTVCFVIGCITKQTKEEHTLKSILEVLVYVTSIVVLLGLLKVYFNINTGINAYVSGRCLWFNNTYYNAAGMFLCLTMMLDLLLFIDKKRLPIKIVCLAILYFGLVLSNSRTATYCFVIFCFIFSYLLSRKNNKKILLSIVFSIFVLFASYFGCEIVFHSYNTIVNNTVFETTNIIYADEYGGDLEEINEIENVNKNVINMRKPDEDNAGSLNHRTDIWKATLKRLFSKPEYVLFGVTPVNVNEFSSDAVGTVYYTHNEFLEIAVDYGILSFFSFLFMIIILLIKTIKELFRRNYIFVMISLTLFISLLNNMLEAALLYSWYPSSFLFFITAGYLLTNDKKDQGD